VLIFIFCMSMMSSGDCNDSNHYVLVHGVCHGAWSWYKLKPLLESAGHKVTVLDLAASGINMQNIDDVNTFSQYTQPLLQLLATIPPNQKVILVGHSLGGLNIALAMEQFPEKVAVGIFVTAFVPDTEHNPSYVLEKVYMLVWRYNLFILISLQLVHFVPEIHHWRYKEYTHVKKKNDKIAFIFTIIIFSFFSVWKVRWEDPPVCMDRHWIWTKWKQNINIVWSQVFGHQALPTLPRSGNYLLRPIIVLVMKIS